MDWACRCGPGSVRRKMPEPSHPPRARGRTTCGDGRTRCQSIRRRRNRAHRCSRPVANVILRLRVTSGFRPASEGDRPSGVCGRPLTKPTGPSTSRSAVQRGAVKHPLPGRQGLTHRGCLCCRPLSHLGARGRPGRGEVPRVHVPCVARSPMARESLGATALTAIVGGDGSGCRVRWSSRAWRRT